MGPSENKARLNGRGRAAARTALVVGVVLGTLPLLAGAPASAETGTKALILGSSVVDGASSAEATEAAAAGFTVTVVDDTTWMGMTAAQFADYQLVVVGDPRCGDVPAAVGANKANLADAVMGRAGGNTKAGNRILIGTDPVFHLRHGTTGEGGRKVIETGIRFAGAQEGATGLYLDTTCDDPDYNGNGEPDALELLGLLTVDTDNWTTNESPPCGGSASLISNAAQFATLTSAHVQGWFCSVHETYPTFPTDWSALAIATDTPTKPTCGTDVDTGEAVCGEAYILIAGSGITVESPNLSLTPATATNPVGTSHTVIATVTNNDESPRPGVLVDFVVTGANVGATGTCVPASCVSDAAGQVRFTYTGTKPGTDTINAAMTVEGSRQTATAEKVWETGGGGGGVPTASINNVTVQEGDAGTTAATFTVFLSQPAGPSGATVAYTTADGTATAGSDYQAQSGTLTIPPGARSGVITVPVVGDTADEPNETFYVNLGSATNAAVLDGQGVGTILDDERQGMFSCRATALRLVSDTAVANPANEPCVDDAQGLPTISLPGNGINVAALTLSASTDQAPDNLAAADPSPADRARAEARVESVSITVGTVTIEAQVLIAQAGAWCAAGVNGLRPQLATSSSVGTVTVNGTPLTAVSGPQDIPLVVGTLRLNHAVATADSVRTRALWLDAGGTQVVVAEAEADFSGNPCAAVTVDALRPPADFDGDGRTDVSVYRPSDGRWFVRNSGGAPATVVMWGLAGDIPVPADYDGDGRTDVAVYRPGDSTWFLQQSAAGLGVIVWGTPGDIPVPGDYDGDGRADLAVFRPPTATWFVRLSTGTEVSGVFGLPGDVPVPADYDGDGRTDAAVYRPATGTWFLHQTAAGDASVVWGVGDDVPVPADYDGDGRADVAVYRPADGLWFLRQSSAGNTVVLWGLPGDVPQPGDYDGDGRADIAVYRPTNGLWFLRQSTAGSDVVLWGLPGDIPLPLPAATRIEYF